jgi:hypothetical protein
MFGEAVKRPRILVCDRGAFLPFAQAFAADADTLYFSEFREVADLSKNAMVGRDVPGIERVDSLWKHIDDVDAIAFPDVGDGDMQQWLRGKGYAVWGSGDAEMLEIDRWEFKRLLQKMGLPVVDTRRLVGLDALEAVLRKEDDRYVKTSFFRGDFESYHHVTWELTEPWFNDLRHRMGPHGAEIETLVELPAPGVEIGFDGYVVDGKFPESAMYGLELKDSAYLGRACAVTDMPGCLQDANVALAEALRKLGARSCYSNEVRVTDDGTAYISDPCLRCGSPPFASMSLAITNWAEIVLGGAHGEVVEPDFAAEYACEIELASPWLESDWLPLKMPDEILPWVRLRRPVVIDGRYWCIPHPWLDIAGSAVGLGDTPALAIDRAIEVAEQIEGYQLKWNKNVKAELLDGWDKVQDACADTKAKAA